MKDEKKQLSFPLGLSKGTVEKLYALAYRQREEIIRLTRKCEELDRLGATLAAGQCLVDGGLIGDDGGTPYCSLQDKLINLTRERDDMKALVEAANRELIQVKEDLSYALGYAPTWVAEHLTSERESNKALRKNSE
jgi:hypothetical protein